MHDCCVVLSVARNCAVNISSANDDAQHAIFINTRSTMRPALGPLVPGVLAAILVRHFRPPRGR
eukprot:scaffold238020_cov14-Prasinocladus_malaysianus.AAC.1